MLLAGLNQIEYGFVPWLTSFSEFSVLKSQLIRFIVGSEKKQFTIHSAVLTKLSTERDSMAIMQTLENKGEGNTSITLEDVDVDTFIRFSEFAYTGDYTTADPEKAHNN